MNDENTIKELDQRISYCASMMATANDQRAQKQWGELRVTLEKISHQLTLSAQDAHILST